MSIEIRLLSKMTTTAELARVYEMGLRRHVFEEPIHGNAFAWMIDYWLNSNMTVAPTWVAMEIQFPSIKLLTDVEESAGFLVDQLKDRYVRSQLQEMMRAAVSASDEDPMEALRGLWQTAYNATETVAPRFNRVNMAETVEARRQRYVHRHDGTAAAGMSLGLDALDAHTRGVLPGELCAVAAFTKIGKTFFLLNAALAARKAGYTPLIMTLEQSISEIEDRVDAIYSGVSYARLQEGTLAIPDESNSLVTSREELAELGDLYVERPAKGERTVKLMVNRARQLGADYLLIDQLSFMDSEYEYRGDRGLTAKHGELIYTLKDEISRDSAGAIPCLMAVQFNRDSQSGTQGGRGELKNFAHSSMIEQTVDLALGLWRTSEMRANHAMMVDIMGARRCDLKNWALSWHLDERTEFSVRQELVEQ